MPLTSELKNKGPGSIASEAIINSAESGTTIQLDFTGVHGQETSDNQIVYGIQADIEFDATVEYVSDVFVEFLNYLEQNPAISDLEFYFETESDQDKFIYNERKSHATYLVDNSSFIKEENYDLASQEQRIEYVDVDALVEAVNDKYDNAGQVVYAS
jgi:hypothetical protein